MIRVLGIVNPFFAALFCRKPSGQILQPKHHFIFLAIHGLWFLALLQQAFVGPIPEFKVL